MKGKVNADRGPCVLGISAHYHDAAAALVCDGEIVAAAQEERFTRRKADGRFPKRAIEYCLSLVPEGAQLDAVGFYEDPRLKLDRMIRRAVDLAPRGALTWPKLLRRVTELEELSSSLRGILPDDSRIYFSSHHRSHAASAFFPSGFDEAAVLVVDGVGEWSTASIWRGSGTNLKLLWEERYPNSLGLFYSAFTQYCGFRVNSGEYKLMGLAPYGEPIYTRRILESIIKMSPDGGFSIDQDYFGFETTPSTISPRFSALFGHPPRRPEDPIGPFFMNVAASVQEVLDQAMQGLAQRAMRMAGSQNLCMAGGVALNCVSNSSIVRNVPEIRAIWIQPAAGDAGGALGVAMDVGHRLDPERCWRPEGGSAHMKNAYLGPEFSNENIRSTLETEALKFEDFSGREAEFVQTLAGLLQEGQVLGYFHGRMEFGPRALGNRSILADPRPKDMLSRVNRKIKFREPWRPLAPIVLEEFEHELFDAPVADPYMLFVSTLRDSYCCGPSMRELRARGYSQVHQLLSSPMSMFPAATHVDRSARSQSLSRRANPRLHAILSEFHRRTDCPMLLNTSFNVRGEPIVCTPGDAVAAFLNTHLDALAIGPYLLLRSSQDKRMTMRAGKRRFHAD